MSTVVTALRRRWEGCHERPGGRIVLRHSAAENDMKAAFGILVLYVSIPLAIVAAQIIVAHETAMDQNAAHATVAQMLPAAAVVARR
jgi:hypothetical protein